MQFKFPDVGEGIHEAKIVQINVQAGETIKKNQIICEVETDKSVVEIPSPFEGMVKNMPHKIGETIHVGDLLLEYETSSQASTQVETKSEAEPEAKPEVDSKPKKEGNVVGSLEDADSTPGTGEFDFSSYTPDQSAAPENENRAEHLNAIKSDTKASPKPKPSPSNDGKSKMEPLSTIRKAIAKNMRKTEAQSVTVTHFAEIQADQLIQKRQAYIEKNQKISYLAFIIEAYCLSLKEFPNFNAQYHQDAESLEIFTDINMGLAVDTENGLMVPVIQKCDNLNPEGINEQIISLAKLAQEQKLSAAQMQGSTVCITNYGSIGGRFATPVLNPGNLINLGIGRMEEKICLEKDHLHSHSIIPISLSYDHQIIDGANAARFINRLEEILNP